MPDMGREKGLFAPVAAQRLGPAIGLFFLAPLVGEFLLGNLPVTWLWALLSLAPLYGGGAVIIRELARRAELGWPGLLVLALAFAVVEEAFVTQSLFRPEYAGLRLLDFGYIPALGIGAWWTVFVLSLHTIWSMAVPIALVESMTSPPRREPWLKPPSLVVAAAVFLLGCIATAMFQPVEGEGASTTQLAASGVLVLTLIGLAFWLRARRRPATPTQVSVSVLAVGFVAAACGSCFVAMAIVHEAIPAALNIAGMIGTLAMLGLLTLHWSRADDWSEAHRFAVAAGLLSTYIWYGFVQVPSAGEVSPAVDLAGNVIFACGASVMLIVTARKLARERS